VSLKHDHKACFSKSRGLARRLLAFVAISLVAVATVGQAHAQTAASPSDADLKVEADILFKRTLLRPDDLDAAFRYSQIETKLGDYEAAIGALERMLFFNPGLPRVKLELGVLYFKLHSYEMARSYFTAAIAGKDTPQDVRDEVASFLTQIDHSVTPSQLSVFAQTGLRYQTNANAGPNSPVVQALGQSALLSSEFQRTPDWNAFGLVTAHHFYDFGDQNSDGWESDVTAYYAKQFTVTRLDLGLIEASTGPRIGLGASGASVHPYVLGNYVSLGDASYLGTVGGGISGRVVFPAGVTLDPGVEFRRRQFDNSSNYPNASGQTGDQWIGYLNGYGSLITAANISWQGRLAVTNASATYEPYAYNDLSVDFALPYGFTAPAFAKTGRPWTFAPMAGYSWTNYREPDPLVNPTITRQDRQLRVGATLDMTFLENWGLQAQVEYFDTQSTLPNFRNNDFVVSAGPTARF
jgi:hypothetical protein